MAFQTGEKWNGNKIGRPKGIINLPALIKGKTRNGAELMEFYLRVLRDKGESTQARLYACDKLVERAYGKAPAMVNGEKPAISGITLIINRSESNVAKGSKLDEIFTVRQIEPPKENEVTEAETVETPAKPST